MNTFLCRAVSLLVLFIVTSQSTFGQITFVIQGGSGSGTSWADADGDLAGVLNSATYGDQIWVAAGTYMPTSCVACTASDRDQSFVIKDGIQIYGGFQGGETSLSQRDWLNNLTILSGDINHDNQLDSNSYSVVYSLNLSSSTIFDGFVIQEGNSNSTTGSNSSRLKSGGGWYNDGSVSSNPTINNTRFQNNFSLSGGGALVNNGSFSGEASPSISNCHFEANECLQNGGAIFNDASFGGISSPNIVDCDFQNNLAKYGAGVYNSGIGGVSNSTIIRCSFIENHASAYSGAIYNFGKSGGTAAPLIYNCLFYKNTASSAGAIYSLGSQGTATPIITNCTFFGNYANTGGAVYCNESVSGFTQATITNCIFWENNAGWDPNFHMSGSGSPKIILNHSLIDAVDCAGIMNLGLLDTLICDAEIIFNEYPMFEDTTNLNFRLLTGSPAIDEGDNNEINSYNMLDKDNHVRVKNVVLDMGVYEYGSQPYQAPAITQQPTGQNICDGEYYTLEVLTSGTEPLDYQWRKDEVNITGETNSSYTISNADTGDIADYTCRIVSFFSDTIHSNIASIMVDPERNPDIELVADITEICAGEAVTFTAAVIDEGTSPTYEWKLNGSIAATTTIPSYSFTNLSDNDEVNCRLTSSEACASPVSITSSSISIDVNPIQTPEIIISSNSTQICTGEQISFTATSTNAGSNPTYDWMVNGQMVGTNSISYLSSTMIDGDVVSCQITSSEDCASPTSVTSSGIPIVVNPILTPEVNISSSSTQICVGESVEFTATPTNGGTNPTYQWAVDGQAVGTDNPVFTSSTLSDGSVVSCQLTSGLDCANPVLVNSNSITLVVENIVEPMLNITSSATQICSGDEITFIANTTNGGSNPTLEWTVNGQEVGTNSSNYSSSTLGDGDLVSCLLISSSTCALPSTANSNPINIEVTPVSEPSIAIIASELEICEGSLITFTAEATNMGMTPMYQWSVDNVLQNVSGHEFTTANLLDGAAVRCELISSLNCAAPASVNSNVIAISVISVLEPAITISANMLQACSGESISFTAAVQNEGSNPVYQWFVNGQAVANEGAIFTNSTLLDGSEIYCQLLSSELCISEEVINSELLEVEITPTVQPEILIAADAAMICVGEMVNFTAIPMYEGPTPIYQWYVNGQIVGANSPLFSSNSLSDGTSVYCLMTSSYPCLTESIISSDTITLQVSNIIEPVIVIEANAETYCAGDSVFFTASALNGGAIPTYEWFVNGQVVSTGSTSVFSSGSLLDGTLVHCNLTSSSDCASPQMVLSNTVEVLVMDVIMPSVMVQSSVTDICDGELIAFEALSIYGGLQPEFDWLINGVSMGVDTPIFSYDLFNDQDTLVCILSSTESCVTSNVVTSEPIIISVNPSLTLEVDVMASDAIICLGDTVTFTSNPINQGNTPEYEWLINGQLVGFNSALFQTNNLMPGDSVSCRVTSSEMCILNNIEESLPVFVEVDSCQIIGITNVNELAELQIFPNPSSGQFTLYYKGKSDSYSLMIYDAQGQIIKNEKLSNSQSSNSHVIDLSKFSSGVYFLKLFGTQNSNYFKLLLKK